MIAAHEEAYTKANIMHRDISVGNILLIPCGEHPVDKQPLYKGMLTDWELSKRLEQSEQDPRQPDRTVRLFLLTLTSTGVAHAYIMSLGYLAVHVYPYSGETPQTSYHP